MPESSDKELIEYKNTNYIEDVNSPDFKLDKTQQYNDPILRLIIQKGISSDDKGAIGDRLFPITVDITNRDTIPGNVVFTNGINQLCIVYYGICPELENFVSIPLWPEYSQHSKETFLKINEIIKSDDKNEIVIKFTGNYRIKLPNEIHPFLADNIDISKKQQWMYEWQFVPYLKEIGNTIYKQKYPDNYKKLFLRELSGNLGVKDVNIKVCVGIVIAKELRYIKIKLPYLNRIPFCVFLSNIDFLKQSDYYIARIDHSVKNYSDISVGDIITFTIFEDLLDSEKNTIYNIEKISSLELLAHVLSFLLYMKFLEIKHIKIVTEEEFNELLYVCISQFSNYCSYSDCNADLFNPEFILRSYLAPFFKLVNGYIYYIPAVAMDKTNKELDVIDILQTNKALAENPIAIMNQYGYTSLSEYKKIKKVYSDIDLLIRLKDIINKI